MSITTTDWTVGGVAELSVDLTNIAGDSEDPTSFTWLVMDPTGVENDLSGVVVRDGVGLLHLDVPLTIAGVWRWRLLTAGPVVAAEGTLEVGSLFEGAVTDTRDLRVLIPACRRAIDGPMAQAPDSPSTTLDDRGVVALLADATAELILFTQGEASFGYKLLPTARDPFYMAPVAWATDLIRDPAADAAILSQAALDHYFWLIKLMKVSETMKNEAVSWEYSLSANVISAWIAYLIGNRDKAIAAMQIINAPMDVYISLVAERDRLAAAWLEPWVAEIGAPVPYVGGGGSGPLEYDYRFSTWG
jgi:hypothetical protein